MNGIGIALPLGTDEVAVGASLAPGAELKASAGFGEMLGEVLTRAAADQGEAERQASALVSGEGDVVDTMIAIGRAELSLRFVVTLRNRALEAYQEIMRLQV